MELLKNNTGASYWFLDAKHGWESEEVQYFFNESCWVSSTPVEVLQEISPGDFVALKSLAERDGDESAFTILATGVVTENKGDGQKLLIEWHPLYDEPREWHSQLLFNHDTVVKLSEGEWMNNAVISFAFDEKWHFRNVVDYWKVEYRWTTFYEAVAIKLFHHRKDRSELVQIVHGITKKYYSLSSFLEEDNNGNIKPLHDICPFTVMGLFNRPMPDDERHRIAADLALKLEVTEPAPTSFEGIPVFHHENPCVFGSLTERLPEDIDLLWELYYAALRMCHPEAIEDDKNLFVVAFDKLQGRANISWNLTVGLFWIQPWRFVSLDNLTQAYIQGILKMPIRKTPEGNLCLGRVYIELIEELKHHFSSPENKLHSLPELTKNAWLIEDQYTTANIRCSDIDLDELAIRETQKKMEDQKDLDIYWLDPLVEKSQEMQGGLGGGAGEGLSIKQEEKEEPEEEDPEERRKSLVIHDVRLSPEYSVDHIIDDGCFIDKDTLDMLVQRLKDKKNLILQGPPGTGKSWLTKRLAYALIGYKHPDSIRTVEFHSNMSYEDFIRGWRPTGDGKLKLVDGSFLEMIEIAIANPDENIVLIIDEVNRGNPTRIFGDMMTMLEADKRFEENAIELAYRKAPGEKIYIPMNLHIIGSMNIADRSLSMIDIALRRRFAFMDLEPTLGQAWEDWVHNKNGIDREILRDFERRMTRLNDAIADDVELGEQFRIGHSYMTPAENVTINDPIKWFKQVAKTEIGPLLLEYWFDNKHKAFDETKRLIEGL
ncbi:MAG: AAA family ATPase [Cellvibrionales bacterium]|nr:AAA family ATPase [Cellvibrionales bacterium]